MRRYVAVVIIGVLIVLLALLMIPTDGTENTPSEPSETEPEIIIEERNGLRIKGVFKGEKTEAHNQLRGERYLIEGMPCEVNEQETVQETECVREERSDSAGQTCYANTEQSIQTDTYQTQETQTVCDTVPVPEATQNASEVAGSEVPDTQQNNSPVGSGLEGFLRTCLESAGIGWWYPYAYAQVMQESHWNPNAVNPNGKDFGLLQYRAQFWTDPGDIMDPYAQIQKYVGQVANRLNAGLSVEETISRHLTSDYVTEVNWTYVNDVLRWMQ